MEKNEEIVHTDRPSEQAVKLRVTVKKSKDKFNLVHLETPKITTSVTLIIGLEGSVADTPSFCKY